MSHAIYQTPAIILKTKNMRESNKLIVLYTERFGLIYTTTQSIRELKSKMRFHTTNLSLVNVDLVRGRNIWKITGIHEQIASLSFVDSPFYSCINNISILLMRLSQGEETNQAVWDDISNIYQNIEREEFSLEDYESLEIMMTARILYFSGYWNGTQEFITSSNLNTLFFDEIQKNKITYIQLINQGIKDSQL